MPSWEWRGGGILTKGEVDMLTILAIIGAGTVLFFLVRFGMLWLRARKQETIYINGNKTTINKLYIQVATEIGLQTKDMLHFSPIIFTASSEIIEQIYKDCEMPYQAVIAYFIAGSALASSQQSFSMGDMHMSDHYSQIYNISKDYADSFAPLGWNLRGEGL